MPTCSNHRGNAGVTCRRGNCEQNLQRSIQEWTTRHELWFDCGFQSYADRIDGKHGETPVITILHFDGDLGRALDGDFDGLDVEFFELLECQGFWYERSDSVSAHIYPEVDGSLLPPFLDRENWQWVCGLVQQDVADAHEELYSHFAKHPEDRRGAQRATHSDPEGRPVASLHRLRSARSAR